MKLKLGSVLALLFMLFQLKAQNTYWQQKLAYRINATLLPDQHRIEAHLQLDYTNESPDTLTFIFFHLWPNAYRDDKTALFRQLKKIGDRKPKLKLVKEFGSITGLDWQVNGAAVKTEMDDGNADVIKLWLPSPLLPHTSLRLTTPFNVQLPNYFSRSGFFQNSFFVTQWFPKPAVYDSKGWHQFPYLDMGEFYSEFGSFHVELTVPARYVVAATGNLETTAELELYRKVGKANAGIFRNYREATKTVNEADSSQFESYPENTDTFKTLVFAADSIHDFAWFADPDFLINYDTLTQDHHSIDVFSFSKRNRLADWSRAVEFAKDAVRYYSTQVGPYPFGSVSMVQGTNNTNSGGMEYPMITLITLKDTGLAKLDAVICHEIGHNWFYSILASNERDHAWMDEGLNSFFQFRYEAEKYRSNLAFGELPPSVKQLDAEMFESLVYENIGRLPGRSAIDKPSNNYSDNTEYGISVYLKAAAWAYALEQKLGKPLFAKCIQTYFTTWQFRHPYPDDLKRVFTEVSGLNLDAYFRQLYLNKRTATEE